MSNAGEETGKSYIRVITLEDLTTNLEMYLELIRTDKEEIILLMDEKAPPNFNVSSGQAFSAVQPLGS